MRTQRTIAWLLIAAQILMPVAASAQTAHEQGLAAGAAANNAVRGLINAPTAQRVVPGYTTTPPEAALAGRTNLTGDANSRLAACAAQPNDPACQAARTAVSSANAPRTPISPADPAVRNASAIARNPTLSLGSIASFYGGCSTADVLAPARTQTRTCIRNIGVGNYECSNTLAATATRTSSCTAGQFIAHSQVGTIGLDVQCLPDKPDTAHHFRLTESGSALRFLDMDMTRNPPAPERLATLASGESVWVISRACSGDNCSVGVLLAPETVDTCDRNPNYPDCMSAPTFLPAFSACPAPQVPGDNFTIRTCDGFGRDRQCYDTPGDPARCYLESAGRISGYVGLPGAPIGPTSIWGLGAVRTPDGWRINPAAGQLPTMTLRYTKPGLTTQVTDQWNSRCPNLAAAGRCSATAPVCVDGPSTKIINGVPVTRDCWEFRSRTTCADTVTSDQCAPLEAIGCKPRSSTCTQTNATTGACEVSRNEYDCAVPAETVTTATACPTNQFCLGTNCFDTTSVNDPDFGRSISMLEGAREAGVYLDTDNMQVFKGESARCRQRLLTNCCHSDSAGRGMTNNSVFSGGSKLVYDVLMNADNRQFITQGLSALMGGAGLSGSFTSYGVTIAANGAALPAGSTVLYSSSAVAGEGMVIAVDPTTLAIAVVIYVVLSMTSCNEEEARLALRQGAGLCHDVGTFCSTCLRILGKCVSCTETTQTRCCFNSMLARIVNEQGRVQVGKGWGSAQGPDCSGFTIAQLQRLNFAAMDLTEFYASLAPASPNVEALRGRNAQRLANCYYGQGKCE